MMANENETPSWLDTLAEGGLPQILAGPAGKAISRLVGAAVEVPASYIDGFAQSIKDKNAARTLLSQVMSEKAAEMAIDDPEIMGRALQSLLGREYRAQSNKEEVARLTVEELQSDPPKIDSKGPSDDWMNKFERHAEDASSDDLRLMYAKILAGEIRDAGSVSPATLHFVSMLDADMTKLIDRILPYTSMDGVAYLECMHPQFSVIEAISLEQSGFWTLGRSCSHYFNKAGQNITQMRHNLGIGFEKPGGDMLDLRAGILSKAGRDLVDTINRPFDVQAFVDVLFKHGIAKCAYGDVRSDGDQKSLIDPVEIRPSKPSLFIETAYKARGVL